MKILILSSKLPYPPKDGGAIATMNLALGLAKSGKDITLLSLNTEKHFFPPEKIPPEITDTIKIIPISVNTSTRPIPALFNLLFSKKPYIAERFYFKSFEKCIRDFFDEGDVDIVQLEGPYMAVYLPLIKTISKAKIALRAHNVEHEIWERRRINESGFLNKLYIKNLSKRIQKFEDMLLKRSDILVAISDRDEQILKLSNPEIPSIVIPTGIDIDTYPLKKSKKSNSVFFIGALDWVPNQEGLLWMMKEVMPYLTEEIPDIKIHIAGRNAPQQLMNQLQHPAIVFHGEVEDAKAFMDMHEIMLAPLLSGSGIRIKILEGMALGKCIVTTPIGAEGLPVTDKKEVLLAESGEEFAKKLCILINDPSLKESISQNARKLIREKFDTFAIASSLGDFYKKIL